MKQQLSHDRLQSECFLHAWNTYPQIRRLIFHPANETPKLPSESPAQFAARLSRLKAIGVVPGVLDLILLKPLTAFDIKMPGDTISPHQQKFIDAITAAGGQTFIISSIDQFKVILQQILANN